MFLLLESPLGYIALTTLTCQAVAINAHMLFTFWLEERYFQMLPFGYLWLWPVAEIGTAVS